MFSAFWKKKPLPSAAPESSRLVRATSVPPEVLDFLGRREELNAPDLMINILDKRQSAEMTTLIQGASVAKRLGLIVLDDANDSNPYCYITGGVAAGMVVHFNHDPEPKIEFESIQAFEAFLRELRKQNRELGEVEQESPPHTNQVALAAVLAELGRATSDEDSEFLICLYLPLLRGEHQQLLEELCSHENFFVRESVAEAIATTLPNAEAAARMLATDPHPQVRSAASRATERLKRARGAA